MHFPERTNIRRMRGSFTVEAALLTPLIIIVLVIFLGLLRSLIGYAILKSTLYDCADLMADYGVIYEALGFGKLHRKLLSGEAEEAERTIPQTEDDFMEIFPELDEEKEFFQSALKVIYKSLQGNDLTQAVKQNLYFSLVDRIGAEIARRLMAERLKDLELSMIGIKDGKEGISFAGTKFFYQESDHGALIRLRISYQRELFPGGAWLTPDQVEIIATVHAFLGDNPFQTGFQTEDSYYRIGEGEKYHRLDCYLIDKEIYSITLWEAQQQGYSACHRCRSWKSGTVWVTSGGEKYHMKGCSYLYPYLQKITKEKAEQMGLTPCELCQGTGGGFP